MTARRWLGGVVLAFMVCGRVMAQDSPAFLVGPYVGPVDASSARVRWVSGPDYATGHVRLAGGAADVQTETTRVAACPGLLHTAALTGLKPSTQYKYEAHCGEVSQSGSFVTAPAAGPAAFRFVVYGDSRFAADSHRQVAEGIAREKPAFVVHTGDLVTDGRVWEQWEDEFSRPAMPFLSKSAFWPALGNHEEDGVLYRWLFRLPGEQNYYSFDFGNAHFVILDNADPEAEYAEMLQWLKDDLGRNRSEWTFVVFHTPIFNVGGHANTWGREDALPVMESRGVDFVIAGHSHLYERFLPIGPAGAKPLIHVVTGGGGAPLYAAVPSPILAGGIGYSGLHFCVFDVKGNRLQMTAKRPDGTVIDRLELVKADGKYQPEVMASAIERSVAEKIQFLLVDLTAEFPVAPRPGQAATGALMAKNLPDGASVTLSTAKGEAGWRVPRQTQVAAEGKVAFQVTAPRRLEWDYGGFRPPLRLAIKVEWDGLAAGVDSVQPALSADTMRLLVPEPDPVKVVHCETPVAVDGDLSEWGRIRPCPLPFSRKDSSSLRLCWREDGLYGAVAAEDRTLKVDPGAPWEADCVELFLEQDYARSPSRTKNTAQYVFAPAADLVPGRGHMQVAYGPYEGKESKTGIACAWRPTESGYALEFHIPAAVLAPARMEEGCKVGMNFVRNDDGRPVELFYTSKAPDGYRTPIAWGALELTR